MRVTNISNFKNNSAPSFKASLDLGAVQSYATKCKKGLAKKLNEAIAGNPNADDLKRINTVTGQFFYLGNRSCYIPTPNPCHSRKTLINIVKSVIDLLNGKDDNRARLLC